MTARRMAGTVVEIEGNGPPVVLIHGLGLTRAMWRWQIPALAERHRVVRYDLPGHGDGPTPEAPCSLTSLAAHLARVLDGLGVERAAVIGFSLGGLIARRFALDHPDRTQALAVLHSPHDRTERERNAVRARVDRAAAEGPAATVEEALARWFTPDFAVANPNVLDTVRGWVVANDPGVYPVLYLVLAEGDAELAGALGAITCPALVVTGADDAGNSPDMARRMAAEMADAETVILPGLRHMALVEDPDAVSSVLLNFLDRVTVATAVAQ